MAQLGKLKVEGVVHIVVTRDLMNIERLVPGAWRLNGPFSHFSHSLLGKVFLVGSPTSLEGWLNNC